uniref:Uncharacterized protein n=1 Tax=Arundo donax TaxID=35708 RepID=A0A0A9CZI3_ARUDO
MTNFRQALLTIIPSLSCLLHLLLVAMDIICPNAFTERPFNDGHHHLQVSRVMFLTTP